MKSVTNQNSQIFFISEPQFAISTITPGENLSFWANHNNMVLSTGHSSHINTGTFK